MRTIGVDTGFLIALYDASDEHHVTATNQYVEYVENTPYTLLLPWPVLYETMRTRMIRKRVGIAEFNRDRAILARDGRLELLDDGPYREEALEDCFLETARLPDSYRKLSLADRVIRGMLSDVNLKIDYFITYNPGDFSDVCRRHGREMVDATRRQD